MNDQEIQSITEEVIDAVQSDDEETLKVLQSDLKDEQVALSLDQKSDTRIDQLLDVIDFARLIAVSDERCLELLHSHLVLLLNVPEFDLLEKFQTRVGLIGDEDEKADFINLALVNLKGNQEVLSTNATKGQASTISQWIALYESVPAKNINKTDLDEVTFINNHKSELPLNQQVLLLEILKIYDLMVGWINAYNNLPEITSEEEYEKTYDINKETPGIKEELAQAQNASNVVKNSVLAKTVLPMAQPKPQVADISKIVENKVQNSPVIRMPSLPAQLNETDTVQGNIIRDINKAKVNPDAASRVEALLKKNIASVPHVQEPKPEIVPQEIAPVSIDEKLEELKKRMNR